MREVMLHIRDVEGPKKTGSMETRLEAMEQQVLKCQGMGERGLNANHMMITEFTNKHMIDANDIGKHLSRLYDRIDHLQAQVYDLQNQNYSCCCQARLLSLLLLDDSCLLSAVALAVAVASARICSCCACVAACTSPPPWSIDKIGEYHDVLDEPRTSTET
ncbi:40S ribosomal protein S5-1 [Hordeum vulgare]|nr:40S ribosomal protein S5-1 [Hordeum vulgare]